MAGFGLNGFKFRKIEADFFAFSACSGKIADLAAARALLRDLREAIEPMIGFVARYECPKSGWPTAPDDIVIVDGVKLETPRRLASLATKIDALLEEVSK